MKPSSFGELVSSLKSLRKAVGKCRVSIYTNIKFDNSLPRFRFDKVIYDKNIKQKHIAKAHGLLKSPYDKTIFLDTDTLIHRGAISEIFKVLDEFSFTCVHCNGGPHKGSVYPQVNTGLLGVKKNDFTQLALHDWIKDFERTGGMMDQPSFRRVFMRHKREFYILPAYFQFRGPHLKGIMGHRVLSHGHGVCKDPNASARSAFRGLVVGDNGNLGWRKYMEMWCRKKGEW